MCVASIPSSMTYCSAQVLLDDAATEGIIRQIESAPPARSSKRRFRFRNPFSLGTISESGDHIPSSKTSPLINDKLMEPGMQFSPSHPSTSMSPITQAGEGVPLDLIGKLQDVKSYVLRLPNLFLRWGEDL